MNTYSSKRSRLDLFFQFTAEIAVIAKIRRLERMRGLRLLNHYSGLLHFSFEPFPFYFSLLSAVFCILYSIHMLDIYYTKLSTKSQAKSNFILPLKREATKKIVNRQLSIVNGNGCWILDAGYTATVCWPACRRVSASGGLPMRFLSFLRQAQDGV